MVSPRPKMDVLVANFATNPVLTFGLPALKVEAMNLSPNTEKDYHAANANVPSADIQNIVIKLSKKGSSHVNISTQINFATDALTYDKMKELSEPSDSVYLTPFLKICKRKSWRRLLLLWNAYLL